MTIDEHRDAAGGPESLAVDPPRDHELRQLLEGYEQQHAGALDRVLRSRLMGQAAVAMQAREDPRWSVATARLARFAVPIGVLAAAASMVFVTRAAPTSAVLHPLMTVAAGSDTASTNPAQLWGLASLCDADVMCGAFGMVLR